MRIVETLAQGEQLESELVMFQWATGAPTGLDTETTGCDPEQQSPVENAKLWCMTLAWGLPASSTPSNYHTAMVLPAAMPALRTWLEASEYHKVGSNIFSYDRHVLLNAGYDLRGIVGDTQRESRLINPSKMLRHGLKPQGKKLGYEVSSMDEICYRPARNKDKTYKRERRVVSDDGVPTLYIAGDVCCFSVSKREYLDWDTLWRDYPQRRSAIARYAVQDACMSLDAHHANMATLKETLWARPTDQM